MSKSSKKRKGKAKGATRNRVAPARQRRQANSMGTLLGEAFAKMVKETQGQPKNDAIGLRVPDFQGYAYEKSGSSIPGVYDFVNWGWHVREDVYFPVVIATKSLGTKEKYEIRVEFGHTVHTLRGDSESAMALAECLVSAADWERSWPMILGTDMLGEPWKPYSRESAFKPKHAQDHIREESTL